MFGLKINKMCNLSPFEVDEKFDKNTLEGKGFKILAHRHHSETYILFKFNVILLLSSFFCCVYDDKIVNVY